MSIIFENIGNNQFRLTQEADGQRVTPERALDQMFLEPMREIFVDGAILDSSKKLKQLIAYRVTPQNHLDSTFDQMTVVMAIRPEAFFQDRLRIILDNPQRAASEMVNTLNNLYQGRYKFDIDIFPPSNTLPAIKIKWQTMKLTAAKFKQNPEVNETI